ncbi:MAG: FtsH protease activity modulator HflK [Alphaproteobacteria bacterium]|nr:FtsH protease activity modulator HflK [Alphaproteobacteria bacterium]
MPWNNDGDGNSGNRGPWGKKPGGGNGGGGGPQGPRGPWGGGQGPGGGQQPPDIEAMLRQMQERLQNLFPNGRIGGGGLGLIAILIAGLWLATGFYTVKTDEQGVVLRFGKFSEITQPGLNYHLPYPIESVLTPPVTNVNRVDVGFRPFTDGRNPDRTQDVPQESLMLTGDENIVDVDFSVFWRIRDAEKFLFNMAGPAENVKAVAQSAMREVIGRMEITPILTEARNQIEQDVMLLTQQVLDNYKAGIEIRQVQLQKVDPPIAVIDAFRDVQAARADLERQRNEAEAYANDIIPRARGEAAQIDQNAQAYMQQTIAEANGDAQRFTAVYDQYIKAKEVTKNRIYLETMEKVLADMNKVVITDPKGSGMVPYLPLPELRSRAQTGETAQ